MQHSKRHDHITAEQRYRVIRQMVYETTEERFAGISAKEISLTDTILADRWKYLPDQAAREYTSGWDWNKVFPAYRNQPNRFDISLWRGNTLGALCYGKTSKAGTRVRLDLIESTPERPTPLGRAALPVLSFAASTFARLVGASEVWILEPLPELEGLYMKSGFGPRVSYGSKRVGQRRLL